MAHLQWKDGEGYDIHVLRGGPPSKALDQSLDLDPQFPPAQFPLTFTPHFKGQPNAFGLKVDTTTGEVTAAAQPNPPDAKFPNFNFLMTANQTLAGSTLDTVIRIHIHDSIKKIWLTPSSLIVHEDADDRRFTVLALFDDDTVGDITEWPQLTYAVPDPAVVSVKVLNRGDLFMGEPEVIGGRLLGRVDPDENPDETHESRKCTG